MDSLPEALAQSPARRRSRAGRDALIAFVAAITLGLAFSAIALHAVAALQEGPAAFGSEDAMERAAATLPGALAAILAVILAEAIVVAAGIRLSRLPARERLRMGPAPARGKVLAAMIACMLLLSHGLDAAVHLAGLGDYGALGLLRDLFRNAGAAHLAAAGLLIGVGVGTMEEMLFRGYIQTGLSGRLGAGRGILLASLLFGAAHMDAVQGPMAMLLGLYLGSITEWTGSIRPAIACHVANNLFGTFAPAIIPLPASPSSHAVSLAVSVVGLAIGVPWIRRQIVLRAFEGTPATG